MRTRVRPRAQTAGMGRTVAELASLCNEKEKTWRKKGKLAKQRGACKRGEEEKEAKPGIGQPRRANERRASLLGTGDICWNSLLQMLLVHWGPSSLWLEDTVHVEGKS